IPQKSPIKSISLLKESSVPSPATTLKHSLSMYRKEQKVQLSDIKHVDVPAKNDGPSNEEIRKNRHIRIQMQICELERDAASQDAIIKQASKAVVHCVAADEFRGSSEHVEGEKLLLLSCKFI